MWPPRPWPGGHGCAGSVPGSPSPLLRFFAYKIRARIKVRKERGSPRTRPYPPCGGGGGGGGGEEELASFHSLQPSGSATCSSRWCRPDPPQISSARDAVIFQQIDIDHYIGQPVEGMPGARNGPVPIVRMYGVTMEGNSVCAHIHGFLPYFYVPAPSEFFTNGDCDTLRCALNDAVLGDMRSNKDGITQAVYAVELHKKCSMLGFHFNKFFPFLKITVATPKLVPSARRVLSNVSIPPYGCMNCRSFESNIDFEVRFMVDTGIVGCNWIECPPGSLILHVGYFVIGNTCM